MGYTPATEEEFEIEKDGVRHKPTGAWFTAYPGMALHKVTRNMLGSVLPDGREYRENDVTEVAQRVWAAELKRHV